MSRKPTSRNYKRLAQRMNNSSVGNRVAASKPQMRSRRGVNQRYARSAVRGEIHQVLPSDYSEDRFSYERRMGRKSYVERNVAASRRRKVALAVVLAAAILLIATLVASFVFVGGIDARFTIKDDSLAASLASESGEGQAVYSLLVADFDDGEDGLSPDAFVVVRTDTESGNAYAISLPASTRVSASGEAACMLGEIRSQSGDAGVVESVNSLLGVKISHYATLSSQNFVTLVDELGGLEVNLPEDISDADAVDMSLSAGEQVLSGDAALFACRANDYLVNAEEARSNVQALVACALMQKACSVESGIAFFFRMDELADYVQTDMDVKAAGAFLDGLRGISSENMFAAALPTYASVAGGKTYQIPETDEIASMMDRIRAGQTPKENVADVLESLNPSSYSVSVYNGGDVIGAASDASDILRQAGFNVTSTGNTTMQVYDETLVVYAKDSSEGAASAIASAFGVGRALQDTVHYSFSTDIYVVVGKDWRTSLALRGLGVDDDGYIVSAEEASSSAMTNEESSSEGETSGESS